MAKRSILNSLWRYVFLTLLTVCLLSLAIIGLFKVVNPPSSSFMLVDQWQNPEREVQHVWVDLENISQWMPLAVIASEDQGFVKHWGIDTQALVIALKDYRKKGSLRGASTISQQTAKNLFLWNGRHYIRKVLELGFTLGLEGLWSKRRIMEVYLNIAEFGDGIYGVQAASQHFFGIKARYLTRTQAAKLAAVLPNPKKYNAGRPSTYIKQRVAWIKRQMKQLGGKNAIQPLLRGQ
ncbi:monofunctional biosynthetic peptidoglycan transglycosylase [Neptunomonas japonica]|uniref:monofunctional biosynthetic peptidoglycan transglycosylase n=1 Tax=Neptunomonas japonica TaxID=417574 RepID=UPI0004152C02|nr:monofunctional biosynthetic peptidoglycan transglycosylase [Neptunomonas japonica]